MMPGRMVGQLSDEKAAIGSFELTMDELRDELNSGFVRQAAHGVADVKNDVGTLAHIDTLRSEPPEPILTLP